MLKFLIASAATALLMACGDAKIEVPPGATLIEGIVQEKRGPCHWVIGTDGKLYSLRYGVLGEIPAGAKVRIIGAQARLQDCPGSVVIEPVVPVRRI